MASDGQQALAVLRKEPGIQLVITDVMMPVMGGFELLKNIRCDNELASLPVVVLTAQCSDRDPEPFGDRFPGRTPSEGETLFLTKPVELAQLLVGVKSLLGPDSRELL